MGRNLSNLFISQSYQFITQISGSELQDGLGNTITGSLLITSSRADNATSASQAISASFATTASFALNAGTTVSTASLLTTASAVNNVITFTKGDGSTFPVTVATGSGGGSVNTGSLLVTASVVNATITYTKGDGSTFQNTVNNVAAAIAAQTADVATEVTVVADASNATRYVSFVDTLSGTDSQRVDLGLTYNPFTNALSTTTVNANTFVGALQGNADTATTASLALTATSSSYAVSASQAQNAVTASFALNVTPINTGSFVTTASISNATTTFTKGDGSTFALTANNVVNANSASVAVSASQAVSASFASNIASGLSPTFANVTASNVLITGTASVALLYTQTISSSVIYSSGSNQFGDASNDVQTLYGTFNVVNGPTNFTGSVNSVNGYTGSLLGTASFATSASQAVSSSFATTASFVASVVSASYALSASQAQNAVSASFVTSASYAVSASQAQNAVSASYAPAGNPFPFTGSAVITGSLVVTGSFSQAQGVGNTLLSTDSTGNTISFSGNAGILGGVRGNGSYTVSNGDVILGGNAPNTFTMGGGGNHMFTSRGSMTGFGVGNAIVGGYDNSIPAFAGGTYQVQIFGGTNNTINRPQGYAAIVAGAYNEIEGYNDGSDQPLSTIVGGNFNKIKGGRGSIILGGSLNTINQSASYDANNASVTGSYGAILASSGSRIDNYRGTVIIGGANITASASNTVYVPNLVTSGSTVISGSLTTRGTRNTLGSTTNIINNGSGYLGIYGGQDNTINNGTTATIIGGQSNTIQQGGASPTIVAARSATITTGDTIGILGGQGNTITNGYVSYCVAGRENTINTGTGNFRGGGAIFGGYSNQITGNGMATSEILGGYQNVIATTSSMSGSIIIGGTGNRIDDLNGAIIIGGQGLVATSANTVHLGNTIVSGSFNVSGSTTVRGATTITGSLNVTGSVTGNVLGNNTDTYTGSAAVQQVVTLTQAEYNAIGSPDANTLYIISGSVPFNSAVFATTGSNTFVGNQVISGSLTVTGSQVITGSLRGNVGALSISSNTASLDCSANNFFTLTLANGTGTQLQPTNIQPGQTISVRISQPATTGSGQITFPSSIKQVSGSVYSPTQGANAQDVITFIAFDTSSLYLSNVKNFV
jgi:hypothetical protein